jgi:hypothetical protein
LILQALWTSFFTISWDIWPLGCKSCDRQDILGLSHKPIPSTNPMAYKQLLSHYIGYFDPLKLSIKALDIIARNVK